LTLFQLKARWVCEKIAQNVAQPIFLSKSVHNFYRGTKYSKNLGHVYNLKKLPKVNNNPMGENSPNLVTLFPLKGDPKRWGIKSDGRQSKEKIEMDFLSLIKIASSCYSSHQNIRRHFIASKSWTFLRLCGKASAQNNHRNLKFT
jgi:hypothetical protein